MTAKLPENYIYWQLYGDGWFREYERRKTFIPYLHIQEILVTEYVYQRAPATVLDFGCGIGRHLKNLQMLPGIEVHGYDQSRTMVAEMRNWASDSWINEHVRIGEPLGRLSYEDQTFDVTFTSEVLVHVRPEDLKSILAELLRVTRGWILHLEPGPETPLIADAHSGCWGHDLEAAYRSLRIKSKSLVPLFSSHVLTEVKLGEQADVAPPFSEQTCKLFAQMEAALGPILNRGIYEESLDQAECTSSTLDFIEIFNDKTGRPRRPIKRMSRADLSHALSVLGKRFENIQNDYERIISVSQSAERNIKYLEDHVMYLNCQLSKRTEAYYHKVVVEKSSPDGGEITLDILPHSNCASLGNQVWIRYVKPEHSGPMMPWTAVAMTPGWRLVSAEGCMYDEALLGESAKTLMLPGGDDPEINFMGHPWSGRLSLKWQGHEYVVDLYRPAATDITVRLQDLSQIRDEE